MFFYISGKQQQQHPDMTLNVAEALRNATKCNSSEADYFSCMYLTD